MALLHRCTDRRGNEIWINIDQITYIYFQNNNTIITFDKNNAVSIREHPADLVAVSTVSKRKP